MLATALSLDSTSSSSTTSLLFLLPPVICWMTSWKGHFVSFLPHQSWKTMLGMLLSFTLRMLMKRRRPRRPTAEWDVIPSTEWPGGVASLGNSVQNSVTLGCISVTIVSHLGWLLMCHIELGPKCFWWNYFLTSGQASNPNSYSGVWQIGKVAVARAKWIDNVSQWLWICRENCVKWGREAKICTNINKHWVFWLTHTNTLIHWALCVKSPTETSWVRIDSAVFWLSTLCVYTADCHAPLSNANVSDTSAPPLFCLIHT